MDAWRLVLKELFEFVFLEWFGWRTSTKLKLVTGPAYDWLKPAVVTPKPLVKLVDTPPKLVPLPKSEAFVISEVANLYLLPTFTLDGIIDKIPYGSTVSIYETKNRWFKVAYQGEAGWMLREDLTEELKEPEFKLGEFYLADAEQTITVRKILKDEFAGALAELPLCAEEYVAYRLKRQGIKIPWNNERPRLAGTWQNLLKGRPGCHIGINPKTTAVMEIIQDSTVGHLAYVEAVYPDQSILISEVGYPEVGQYSERTVPKAEWIEWRPVFIEIT